MYEKIENQREREVSLETAQLKIRMETSSLKLQKWWNNEEYVTELYEDVRRNTPQIEKLTGPTILSDEVRNAISSKKSDKTDGEDWVVVEMLEASDEFGIRAIADLVN